MEQRDRGDPRLRLTRRALLKRALGAGSVVLLAACAPAAQPPAAPTPAPAAPTPTRPPAPAATPMASPAATTAAATPAAAAAPIVAATSAAVVAPSGEPVKLGVLTPLSPPGDHGAGQLILRGARLGVEYVNSVSGGVLGRGCGGAPRPIDLVIGDSSGVPEKGVAAFRKLVLDDKVVGVFGEVHSSVMLALGPVADQLKVPMLSTFAGAGAITANHYEYIFQTHSIVAARTAAAAGFFKENALKKIAMLAENTDYGTDHINTLQQALQKQGSTDIEFKNWVFDRATADFGPLLLQVKAFDPDVVYNVAAGQPIYLLLKQATDAGLHGRALHFISTDNPIRPEFWQNVGDAGKGVVFIAFYHPGQKLTEPGEWVRRRYQETHNEPIVYNPLGGFGNVLLYAQAIDKSCSTEGQAIAQALEAGPFTSWNVENAKFPRAEGADWHRLDQPILIVQYTEANQPYDKATILYPQALKSGELQRPSA